MNFSKIIQFFILIFSNFDCIFLKNAISTFISEVDSESLSTLRKIIFKREASRVEGYVTPSCTEMRLSVRNLRKFEKVFELSQKFLKTFLTNF
jgi:hypothetical protein